MGTGTLTSRSTGETITSSFFNDFNSALQETVVGRNSSGAATSGQSFGSASIPWGSGYFNSLIIDGSALDTSQITSPANRIVSGATRASSNQPHFLTANGSALSLTIDGATTNLVFDVNGAAVTCSTNITVSSLTAAPSSNNTCTVNMGTAADQESTRYWGEERSDFLPWSWGIGTSTENAFTHSETITVDAMGSEITSLVGKFAAFKINDGSNDEYFLAYVKSTTELTQCLRGCFLGSNALPINRIKFANNDTITLMKLTWVFLTNDGTTADVTYNNPVWSFDQPGSPTTGDYWYDLSVNQWKRYSGSAFVSIERTLIGIAFSDATNCLGTRSMDFFYKYDSKNTLKVERSSATNCRVSNLYGNVYVYSGNIDFKIYTPQWNITTDLAATGTKDAYLAETATTFYYLYIKDTGDRVMSDIGPQKRDDLLGSYHPSNPWRCVGVVFNDGSSNLVNDVAPIRQLDSTPTMPVGSIIQTGGTKVPSGFLYCDGSAISRTTYSTLFNSISTNFGNGDTSTTFNVPDLRGYFLRGQDDGSSHDPDDGSRTAISGGNTGDNIGSYQADQNASHTHSGAILSAQSTQYRTVSYSASADGNLATGNNFSSSVNATGGNQSNPRNVYVRYYIKY
tara:strand:- start:1611 stop:3488 length:1878 start_codon:yes stop_codon:yes gene_type:complete